MRPKVFFDTNVLMDLVVHDRPGSESALMVMSLVKHHVIEAEVTTQSLLDAVYIARREGTPFNQVHTFMMELVRYVNIGYIDSDCFMSALENPTDDFEDAAQYHSAKMWVCDYFLTRDKGILARDDSKDVIRIITPEDFLINMIKEEEV